MERFLLGLSSAGAGLLLLQRRYASALSAALLAALALRLGRRAAPARHGRYPRQYVARRGTVEVIDGDLEKAIWALADWSEDFVEIRGPDAPQGSKPMGWEATKVKMLWDDEYLYIAAMMDVDAGTEIVAKYKERNSPIFHSDSDFEVFVDPAGCCHGYKELEMNALNTVWNLMLDRPYSDGGSEHSGRVAKPGEARYWDVSKQKTAVKVTKGQVNNPTSKSQWCVEIALAHTESLMHAPVAASPRPGHAWRINFSRVEKEGKVNWVWAPQVVWSPTERRYAGHVNMHLPDAWGYLLFADEKGTKPMDWRDPHFAARHAAACVYYAAKAFHEAKGRYPNGHEVQGALKGAELQEAKVEMQTRKEGYNAIVTAAGRSVQINHLRLMTIV